MGSSRVNAPHRRIARAHLFAVWVAASTAALLLAAWLGWALSASSASRPNIVLITADTLRPDHLGAYGYERAKTPAIDLIAKIGRRFTQATTPFPRTTPALA